MKNQSKQIKPNQFNISLEIDLFAIFRVHMYIWNNMFFSLGFDVKEHYKDFGGDAAAHAAPTNDLQGVRAINTIDLDGLHTLGTVVVDYRGMRVTAQTIVPGILEKEQEQSVVYGSTDFGKTCASNDKYKELLEKVATLLKIKPHSIQTEKGDVVELLTAVECKGIIGNDGRHYLLDLLRMMPPDVNYLPGSEEEKKFFENQTKQLFFFQLILNINHQQ